MIRDPPKIRTGGPGSTADDTNEDSQALIEREGKYEEF